MSRRSPAEFYLKCLLLEPEKLDNKQIIERAESEGLDALHFKYLDLLRTKLRPPELFHLRDKLHRPSQDFLHAERLVRYFLPDADMQMALRILSLPRAKEAAEVLTLSSVPPTEIAFVLTRRFKAPATPRAVQSYQHFFWNMDLLDSVEVRGLLQLRAETSADRFGTAAKKKAAVRRAHYSDPRRVAANLPSSPFAAKLALMQMGIMPTGLDAAELAEHARTGALLRLNEAIAMGGPAGAEQAITSATVAKMMNELVRELAPPEASLIEKANMLRLQTEEGELPTLHSVTGGNHTTELMLRQHNEDEEGDDVEVGAEDDEDPEG